MPRPNCGPSVKIKAPADNRGSAPAYGQPDKPAFLQDYSLKINATYVDPTTNITYQSPATYLNGRTYSAPLLAPTTPPPPPVNPNGPTTWSGEFCVWSGGVGALVMRKPPFSGGSPTNDPYPNNIICGDLLAPNYSYSGSFGKVSLAGGSTSWATLAQEYPYFGVAVFSLSAGAPTAVMTANPWNPDIVLFGGPTSSFSSIGISVTGKAITYTGLKTSLTATYPTGATLLSCLSSYTYKLVRNARTLNTLGAVSAPIIYK